MISNAKKKRRKPSKKEDLLQTQQVEDALFRRATGYDDADGHFVQPDVRAAMYWLENRSPERWKKNRRETAADDAAKSLTGEEQQL